MKSIKKLPHSLFPQVALMILFWIPVQAQKSSPTIDEKVEALLAKMTLEEKIGQMNQYNGFWDVTGPAPNEEQAKKKYDHLKSGLVGSVLNVVGVDKVRRLQELVVKESRLGIPLIFGYDVIHGQKTLTPIPLAEAASWDLEAIEKASRVAAIEASAMGLNWTFAPMMDISRDPRWGRVMEGAGEDPFLNSKVAVARVKGFQGNDLAANNTIAACAKHFAGYGFSEAGRDYNTVDIGTSVLYNMVLPPFKAAVEADVKTVMNSFNVLNGIPATGNRFLQRDILKRDWKFKGVVVSDWGSIGEMVDHGFASDLSQASILAANAGNDMDMESYAYVTHLKKNVDNGAVNIATIDEAARRILRLKFELGLFDDPYRYCNAEREKTLLNHPDHMQAALDVAKKSIVLLKNEGSLLPLSKTQQGIAVIGTLANDKTSPLGSWRLGAEDNTAVSVLEGIKPFTGNTSFAKGVEVFKGKLDFIHEVAVNETDSTGFAEAIELARKSKVVVMVLGEHGYQSGEGRSRTKLNLPGLQENLLKAVYMVNKNIVLVVMSGRPLVLNWAHQNIPAIVQAWQLGTQSGNAIAQVLFGAYNPSGKLPMSFPRSVGQIPLYYNYNSTGRPAPKDLVFWTHYSDESNEPLYPFGYGLSYTKFDYSDLVVSPMTKGFRITVSVKNAGTIVGEEVTQLYIRDKVASVVRPVKELKGFKKYVLQPGEKKTIEFVLTEQELGFYDNDGKFIVEPGEFDIMVGTNSQSVLKTTVSHK